MRYWTLLIIIALFCCGCSTASSTSSRSPVSVTLETAQNLEFWNQTAAQLQQKVPEYQVSVAMQNGSPHLFNRINYRDDQASICLAPKTNYDFAGNLLGFTPLYCTQLDPNDSVNALDNAIQAYQNGYVAMPTEESNRDFRSRILNESSPQNPICFSVYSDLFSSGNAISDILEENYLIACANRIDGEPSWPFPASILASWLRVEAALLSNQNSLIATAFHQTSQILSKEAEAYGASIEGYTEILAKKLSQAEITALHALKISDEAGLYFLSRQNAQILAHIASMAESMDGKRLEKIVRALNPGKGLPANVTDVRTILMLHTCQMSIIIPDVSASLVSACLPWIKMSTRNADDFEMALMLIEHGIYGTPRGERAIEEDVLSWLKYVSLNEELSGIRKSFGQRLSTTDRLSEEEKAIVQEF